MTTYSDFHRRSIDKRDEFWAEQAELVHWNKPPQQICDFSNPPFVKWFKGGETNLCYNAVDRHAAKRPNDQALVYISTETNEEKVYCLPNCRPRLNAWRRSIRSSASRRAIVS